MRVALRFPHPLARGLPRMVSYSIGGHLLLGVAILTVPGLMPRASAPLWDQPITAMLMDAPPPRAAAPAAAEPAAAAPEPAAPKAQPAPEPEPPPPPPPKPKKKPAPKKPPEKKVEEPAAKPKPQTPPATGQPVSGAATEPQAAAPVAGVGDAGAAAADEGIGVSYGGVSFGYSYYNSQMVNKLRANWQRPVFPADAPAEMGVRLRFRIDRRGQVSEVSVETPSNYPALDTSALRAVHAAAPFPPLPPQFTEETLLVAITFTLQPKGL